MSIEKILFFCESTAKTKHRSGIHRVSVELLRNISRIVPTDIVKWDNLNGQLSYFDLSDFRDLFGQDIPEGIECRMESHRVNGRFGDTIDQNNAWLVFPEIAYLVDNGNEKLSRIISQCREYGVKVASIFYDVIPITNDHYKEYRDKHIEYVVELSRVDQITPISIHAGKGLHEFYSTALSGQPEFDRLATRIRPILLPEGDPVNLAEAASDVRDTIVMVGTVEPRKQQTEALEAINRLREEGKLPPTTKVDVVGSLHPAVSERFRRALAQNPNATYHAYISDDEVQKLYQRAKFAIFASNDEGYGLPVAESLVRGIPCLTANFGSMAEIAAGGGCLCVDVNDPKALAEGIRLMYNDKDLLRRLTSEIAVRPFRNWKDYASEFLASLESLDSSIANKSEAARSKNIHEIAFGRVDFDSTENQSLATYWQGNSATMESCLARSAVYPGTVDGFLALAPEIRRAVYESDVLAVADETVVDGVISACVTDGFRGLLPPTIIVKSIESERFKLTEDAMMAVARRRLRRREIAEDETNYMGLWRHYVGNRAKQIPLLSIVISTYNRKDFVVANAEWIAGQIAPYNGRVNLTIVDNVSEDGSWEALQRFAKMPYVTLVQNPTNTGMLGNLNVCSTLQLARHVWVTGDDDYIVPGAIAKLLEVLEREPGLPLAFVNFAVYHRLQLKPGDRVAALVDSSMPLAAKPHKSGIRPVRDIAAEHDNLFTAVYPIIFRSDILAACFNYPFTGIPFLDLVESVPTTKIILESYGDCPAWWSQHIGIAGNASNSWSRHRPRWHGLLMPLVLEAAREAGVDAMRVREWADIHLGLFREATEIARRENLLVHMESPEDVVPGKRVFLGRLSLPPDLRYWRGDAFRVRRSRKENIKGRISSNF